MAGSAPPPSVQVYVGQLGEIRNSLLAQNDHSAPSTIANGHYLALDGLARDILREALRTNWEVPASDRRRIANDIGVPAVVKLARSFAPEHVSREALDRLEHDFHHRRNVVEHERMSVTPAQCMAFLELVEGLGYAVIERTLPAFPEDLFPEHPGVTLVTAHTFTRGMGPGGWLAAHGAEPREEFVGQRHVVSFWTLADEAWEYNGFLDVGTQYVATVLRVATRSPLQEELLVWRRSGESMGSMRYDVLGHDGAGVARLLSRAGAGLYVEPLRLALLENAGDQVIRFVWEGDAYVGTRVIRPVVRRLSDHAVNYRVSREGRVLGAHKLRVKVGDRIVVTRDDFEPVVVRLLYSGDVLEWESHGRYRATASGEGRITLIPNVYDWDDALEVEVVVEDANSR